MAEHEDLGEVLRSVVARLDTIEAELESLKAGRVDETPATPAPSPAVPVAATPMPAAVAAAGHGPSGPSGWNPSPPPPQATDRSLPPPPATASLAPAQPVRTAAERTESILRWGGIVLLVFAALFLVGTAADRGWIGPKVQWSLAGVLGLALIGGSAWIAERQPRWSLALGAGGVLTLAIVVVAGHSGLDLYGPAIASVFAAVVAAISVILALWYGRASLAALGVGVALFSPLFSGESDNVSAGSIWFSLVVIAGVGLAMFTRWHSLRLSTLLIAVIPVSVVASAANDPLVAGDGFAAMMLAIVGGCWLVAVSALRPGDDHEVIDGILHRVQVFYPVIAWVLGTAIFFDSFDRSWGLALGLGAVLAAVAVGFHMTETARPTAIGGVAVAAALVAAIGIPIGLNAAGENNGWALTLVAWVLITAVLMWTGRRLSDSFTQIAAADLGLGALAGTAIGIVVSYEADTTIWLRLSYLVVVASLGVVAWFWRGERPGLTLAIATWVGGLLWIGSALLELPQGVLLISVVWAVLGGALFITGLAKRNDHMVIVGFVTLGVVVVKLFLVDLVEVDSLWRALLFFVVGIVMLRLGVEVARRRKTPLGPDGLTTTVGFSGPALGTGGPVAPMPAPPTVGSDAMRPELSGSASTLPAGPPSRVDPPAPA